MNYTVTTLIAGMMLLGCVLHAAPPYDGYQDSQYHDTGKTKDWIPHMRIEQGGNVVVQRYNLPESDVDTVFDPNVLASLTPGTQYSLLFQVSTGLFRSQAIMIWIDYNNDGTFSADERAGYTPSYIPSGGQGQVDFTTREDVSGLRRMRIRCARNWFDEDLPYAPVTMPPFQTLGPSEGGQTNDYLVDFGFNVTTNGDLPTAAVNMPFQANFFAGAGEAPFAWQGSPSYVVSGSLPPGLTASVVGTPARLQVSGTPQTSGVYSFTLEVKDAKQYTATRQFEINVIPAPYVAPFHDNFSTDKGWLTGLTWSRGSAVAYNPSDWPSRSEPGTDYSPGNDNMILGDTIGGDFARGQGSVYYAVSPVVDCSALTTVRLRLRRWLGCTSNASATIDASTDGGVTWTNMWAKTPYLMLTDQNWTLMDVDITSLAAGNPTVQVRFGIGESDYFRHTGWCIDDVAIDEPAPELLVEEGGQGGTAIVDDEAVGGLRDFGQVGVSMQSSPLVIALTNQGSADITFGTFAKTGANPGDFYLNAGSLLNPLPPGQTTSFEVRFYRTSTGTSTCTIEVPHDGAFSGSTPFQINLEAEAVTPAANFELRLGGPTGPLVSYGDAATGTGRDFGNRDMSAGASAPITFCVVNSGTGSLALGTPDIGGAAWTEYTINLSGLTTLLVPGAHTTFTVTFDPQNVGQRDAIVRVPHSDSAQTTPFLAPITGNGVPPGPAIGVDAGGSSVQHDASAAGTSRDFGLRHVAAGPSAPLTVTLTNTGSVDLNVGAPVLGGADSNEFGMSATGFPAVVAPGNSVSLDVTFDPSTAGVKNALIAFTHDDVNTASPFNLRLTGEGQTISGIITARETDAAGTILANPAPATGILDFGAWDLQSGPTAAAVIYVENTGNAPLTLGMPALTQPGPFIINAAGFTGTLAVGVSAVFTVAFDPSALGTFNGVIEFSHDDPTTGTPFVLNMVGDGINFAPVIDVTAGGTTVASGGSPIDFGSIDVNVGPTATMDIVIANAGTADLHVTSVSVSGPDFKDFNIWTWINAYAIAPGNNTTWNLNFDPTWSGIKDAVLTITHDDPSQPSPFLIPLRGIGTDPNGVMITTTSLPAGEIDRPYAPLPLSAIQGTAPYTWSIYSGALPPGMSLGTIGTLGGTPVQVGDYSFTVRVKDQNGATHEKLFDIRINGSLRGDGASAGGGCTASGGGLLWPVLLLALIAAGCAGGRRARRD